MGKFFSDAVEQALRYIYYSPYEGKGREGLRLLQEASQAGDGDASLVLARCLSGFQHVWAVHGFPEDDEAAVQLVRLSVAQGSAMGPLVAIRMGELTPAMERDMPFQSLQEAWEIVLEKAKGGEPFCQYLIGNTYYFGDFLRIQNVDPNAFPSQEAWVQFLRENISQCEYWLSQAFQNGIYLAGNNLRQYYKNGEENILPPQPEKAEAALRQGAELGYSLYQCWYADHLLKKEDPDALKWYQKAAAHQEPEAWGPLGKIYELGRLGVQKDPAYAAQCYEKGLADPDNILCYNRLGALYCDGEGVPQDYARGFQLLKHAYGKGNAWGVYYLGTCCFYGRGTRQDYGEARKYLEQVDWNNREAFYCLGVIYGRGLGVAEDIPKAVKYLQDAKDFPAAREELLNYKKTLFGKWVRRR